MCCFITRFLAISYLAVSMLRSRTVCSYFFESTILFHSEVIIKIWMAIRTTAIMFNIRKTTKTCIFSKKWGSFPSSSFHFKAFCHVIHYFWVKPFPLLRVNLVWSGISMPPLIIVLLMTFSTCHASLWIRRRETRLNKVLWVPTLLLEIRLSSSLMGCSLDWFR